MMIDKVPVNNFSELEKTKEELKKIQIELEKTKLELQVAQTTIKDLEDKRHVDSLTGLPNNPKMILDKLIKELNFSDENSRTNENRENTLNAIGVAHIDINRFKVINDTYGEDVGDEAIVAFTEHLKEATRSDLIFRYHKAGDEFIIIFPIRNIRDNRDISYEALEKLFEKLEKRVNDGCFVKIEKDGSSFPLSASMDFEILKKGELKTAPELLKKAWERMKIKKQESGHSR